jgi:RNA polymerase sigma factor (sigma-70 family)
MRPILHLIRRVVEEQRVKRLADQELLRRFSAERDEAAFHALLHRHGPMVLDVCRNVLSNEADAEDAFQATFLILARKAAAIRRQTSVGSWLYGVAYRTALKAQTAAARRRKYEARATGRTPPPASDDLSWREVRQVLHAELNDLSEYYRAPLVLCYLQGKTQDEAAALLGVSKTTVKKRLEDGRALLRQRLVRRGLGSVAVLVAAAWPLGAAAAQAPEGLIASTVEAARLFAAGAAAAGLVPARVAALTHGALGTVSLTKGKVAAALLLAAGLLVAGVVSAGRPAAPPAPPRQLVEEKQDKPPDDGGPAHAPDRRRLRFALEGHNGAVRGVAFSPDGKLLASASDDTTIKIWNTATGKEVRTLAGHGAAVASLAFAPDGRSLASVSSSREGNGAPDAVILWDVATGTEKVRLKGNAGSFSHAAFTPDGKVLAASSTAPAFVRLWDTATGGEPRHAPRGLGTARTSPRVLAFSPDGKTLAVGTLPSAHGIHPIRLWNWAEKKPARSLNTAGGCCYLAFAPDGKTLITLNTHGDLTYWDFANARALKTVNLKGGTTGVAMSADARVVALPYTLVFTRGQLRHYAGKAELQDAATGELVETIGLRGPAHAAALSADGRMLAIASGGPMKSRVPETSRLPGNLDPPPPLTGDTRGVVRIWDLPAQVSASKP